MMADRASSTINRTSGSDHRCWRRAGEDARPGFCRCWSGHCCCRSYTCTDYWKRYKSDAKQRSKGYPATKPGQETALIEEILRDWARIDILINIPTLPDRINLQDISDWEWQSLVDRNLSAPFYFMRAASTCMALQAGGVILNFTAAEKLGSTEDGSGAFFACNAGIISMTRTAAREFDGDNIRVHAICSGDLALFSDRTVESFNRLVSLEMLNGVTKLAVYLCSPGCFPFYRAGITDQSCTRSLRE